MPSLKGSRFVTTRSVVFAVALVCPMLAKADSPTTEWVRRYTGIGNGNNQVNAMVVSPQGDTYITGNSSGTWWDIAVAKYSPGGTQLKAARWNGPGGGDDVSYGIALDGQGNVFVAGYTDGNGQYNYDLVLLKYDANLVFQWSRIYASPTNVGLDEAFDVVADAAGNAYVAGFSFGSSNDFVTLKYGPDGTQQWVRRYDGPGQDQDGANAIALDADGNVCVTGLSNGSLSTLNMDVVTIKYSSSGTQQWIKRYNGPGNAGDSGIDIVTDSSRNIYVAGYATGIGSHFDFNTIKYAPDGTELWVRRHDDAGHDNDAALAMALDGAGNVYVTGDAVNPGTHADYTTIKYSTDGVEQWVRDYDGPVSGYDEGQAIAVDAQGNAYVTGYSDGGVSMVDYDYATLKYDSAGNLQWQSRYQGTGNNIDVAQEIAVLGSGDVIVSGWSTGTHLTDVDFTTIRYDQNGAATVGTGTRDAFALRIAPNPLRERGTITFRLPADENAELSLFDASGRHLRTLASGSMQAGEHSIDLDAGALRPGVYFYRLQTAGTAIESKLTRVR